MNTINQFYIGMPPAFNRRKGQRQNNQGDRCMDTSETVAMAEGAASSSGGPLRVLGRANSFNVRKVLWVCDEIGIPFIREDFGRGFKPTNTPEFLKLNLTGQVPV